MDLKIWKTIRLGVHKTSAEYREAILRDGSYISNWGNALLDLVEIAQVETEIGLAVVTAEMFELKGSVPYGVTLGKALEAGARRCPTEVGPALRLQYRNHPHGEWNTVMMPPLLHEGQYHLFSVNNGYGDRWLDTRFSNTRWDYQQRFIVEIPLL